MAHQAVKKHWGDMTSSCQNVELVIAMNSNRISFANFKFGAWRFLGFFFFSAYFYVRLIKKSPWSVLWNIANVSKTLRERKSKWSQWCFRGHLLLLLFSFSYSSSSSESASAGKREKPLGALPSWRSLRFLQRQKVPESSSVKWLLTGDRYVLYNWRKLHAYFSLSSSSFCRSCSLCLCRSSRCLFNTFS